MAHKNKDISDNIEKILAYCSDPGHENGISQKEFQNLMGLTSRTSFYNYLKELEKHGINFSIKKIGKISYYRPETDVSELTDTVLSSLDYYSFLISRELSYHPEGMYLEKSKSSTTYGYQNYRCYHWRSYLFDSFSFVGDEGSFCSNTITVGIKETRMKSIINQLVNERKIRREWTGRAGYVYYPIQQSDPSLFTFSSEQALNLIGLIKSSMPKDDNHGSIFSAYNKLCLATGNISDSTLSPDNYLSMGLKKKNLSELQDNLSRFSKMNYVDYSLNITYKENGIIVKSLFNVGMFVFVERENTIYVMGKSKGTPGSVGQYAFIDIADILVVEQTEYQQEEYKDKMYSYFYNHMFSISVEKPRNVVISFRNLFNIEEKVNNLLEMRKETASVKYTTKGDIIYKDSVSDYENLLPYINSFGRAGKVEEPPELAETMKEEIIETLSEYERAGFDVKQL